MSLLLLLSGSGGAAPAPADPPVAGTPTTAGITRTINQPSGEDGTLLVWHVFHAGTAVTFPAGWELVATASGLGGYVSQAVQTAVRYVATWSGEPSTYSVTGGSINNMNMCMIPVSGANAASEVNAVSVGNPPRSVTTTADNTLLLLASGNNREVFGGSDTVPPVASTFTSLSSLGATSGDTFIGVTTSYKTQESAGSTGDVTSTNTDGMVLLAIEP